METMGLEPTELDEGPPSLETTDPARPLLDTMDYGLPTADTETMTMTQQAMEYEPITPVTGSPTNFDGVMSLMSSQPLFAVGETMITLMSQQENAGTFVQTLTLMSQRESVGTSLGNASEALTLMSQRESVGTSLGNASEALTLMSQRESVGTSLGNASEALTLMSQQESVGTCDEALTLMSQQESVGTCDETFTLMSHQESVETTDETFTLISHQESVETTDETFMFISQQEGTTHSHAGTETSAQPLLPGETGGTGETGETGAQAGGGETGAQAGGGETPGASGGQTAAPGRSETGGAPAGTTGTIMTPPASGKSAAQTAGGPSRTEPGSRDGAEGMTMMMITGKSSGSAPGSKASLGPAGTGGGLKKLEKVGGPLPRRYFPGKRPLDPLKMDMSKPVVMPLSSSQMSLQCLECHIIFSDSKSMERHLKLNHPAQYEQCILRNATFACYVCDRHFTNSTELMVHQKAHVEKKAFKCPICSQAYKKSSELTLHKKVHFGEDGYACGDCGKPCKTLTLLKYHRRIHTGETPYVCRECGARFAQTKALQKHQLSHDDAVVDDDEAGDAQASLQKQPPASRGASEAPGDAQPKKKAIKYPCSSSTCKAVFRTARGRCRHMKNKHGAAEESLRAKAGSAVVSTITPISICQPSPLQVESLGPLQKVDSQMDTALICRLIQSMGNVHRVNQVVVLGQVATPPVAPPPSAPRGDELRGQGVNITTLPQVTELSGAMMMGLDPGRDPCDPSLEHTIILEPITPDGQLINPGFRLTALVSELELDAAGQSHAPDPEQTVILELTSVLTPTEQFHRVPPEAAASLIPTDELEDGHQGRTGPEESRVSVPPPLIPTIQLDLDQQDLSTCTFMTAETPNHLPGDSQTHPEAGTLMPNLSGDSQTHPEAGTLMPNLSGDSQTHPEAGTSMPNLPGDSHQAETTLNLAADSQTNPDMQNLDSTGSKMPTERIDGVASAKESAALEEEESRKINHVETSAKELLDSGGRQEQSHTVSVAEEPLDSGGRHRQSHTVSVAEESLDSGGRQEQSHTVSVAEELLDSGGRPRQSDKLSVLAEADNPTQAKQSDHQADHQADHQTSVAPVNVMSAQELVKVRKRKTQLAGPMYSDYYWLSEQPLKRQRTKKSLLVVKFGPKKKEKRNEGQRTPSPGEDTSPKPSEKKAALKKKGGKTKKALSEQDSQLEQMEEDSITKTLKRQQDAIGEDETEQISQGESTHSPVVKKKKQQKAMQKDWIGDGETEEILPGESTDTPAVKKKKQQKKAAQKDLTPDGEMDQITSQESAESPATKKKKQQKNVQKESISDAAVDEQSPVESTDMPAVKKKKQQKTLQKDLANGDNGTTDQTVQEESTDPVGAVKKQPRKTKARTTSDAKPAKKGPKGKPRHDEEEEETETGSETTSPTSSSADQQIKRDALLLLRGHMQPQLKVYKLDPSKAACGTPDPPLHDPVTPTDPQETPDTPLHDPVTRTEPQETDAQTHSPPDELEAGRVKGKGGRPKKNHKRLTLLASRPVATPPAQLSPAPKPKAARKRRNPNVETEGVITSRHALECKECGERFSEVSTLQLHKASMHVVESPGLTYTNGNVFEGLSSHMHLCPAPTASDGGAVGAVMNAAASDWDTSEAEAGEAGSAGSAGGVVSFPDLNVSPSLPVPGADGGGGGGGGHPLAVSVAAAQGRPGLQSLTPPPALSPGCLNHSQTVGSPPRLTSVTPLPGGGRATPSSLGRRRRSSGRDGPEDGSMPARPAGPEVVQHHDGAEEDDVKDDLMLEVDMVTVGDQNEREEEPANAEHGCARSESVGGGGPSEMNSTSQTASCSMVGQSDVKEEEEETAVQQSAMRGAGLRGGARRRRGGGRSLKRSGVARRRSVDDAARGGATVECQPPPPDDNHEPETAVGQPPPRLSLGPTAVARPTRATPSSSSSVPPPPPPSEQASSEEEQLVFELESVTTSVEEADLSRSPGLVLERFLTARHSRSLHSAAQDMDSEDDEEGQVMKMKMEQSSQHVRSALVKQEMLHPPPPPPPLPSQQAQFGALPRQAPPPGRHTQWRAEDCSAAVSPGAESNPSSAPAAENASCTDLDNSPVDLGNSDPYSPSVDLGNSDPYSPSVDLGNSDPYSPSVDLQGSRQCIFYPVKEEEREELLEATPTGGSAPRRADRHSAADDDINDCSPEVEESEESGLDGGRFNDYENMDEEGEETDAEWQSAPQLRDFLLQSSDEEDGDVCDLSDRPPDPEARTMASYHHNDHSASPLETRSVSPSESLSRSREPMEYFSGYFGRDAWVEIAQSTNGLSKLPSQPTTAREVAQYVGIHIAMGTLKFPSLKLYWQDFTRVALIADAMPLSRFLQLSHKLRLASRPPPRPPGDAPPRPPGDAPFRPPGDAPSRPPNNTASRPPKNAPPRPPGDTPSRPLGNAPSRPPIDAVSRTPNNAPSSTPAASSRCNGGVRGPDPVRGDEHSDSTTAEANDPDPLWKVRSLLARFQAALGKSLPPLGQDGQYGVDQYRVPLEAGWGTGTGRACHGDHHHGGLCLQATALVGPGGQVRRLELTVGDRGDKEATVERLVPHGDCMVFLCQQELSTPAMLERLLASGVHCAGRVGGGAREGSGGSGGGHVGDQFVSSDGRLVLRRAPRGFVLSTAGSGHRSMAQLVQHFHRAQGWARLSRELQGLYRIPVAASTLTSTTSSSTSTTTQTPGRWPLALLWYLVDLALVNAWLQYRQQHGGGVSEPLSFMAFRLDVSKTLIFSQSSSSSGGGTARDSTHDPQDSVTPRRPPPPTKAHQKSPSDRSPPPDAAGPPARRGSSSSSFSSSLPDASTRYDGAGHWPEQLGEGEAGGRCRFGGCERTSRVMCLKCCVFLCISRHHNCFLNFHSRGVS